MEELKSIMEKFVASGFDWGVLQVSPNSDSITINALIK